MKALALLSSLLLLSACWLARKPRVWEIDELTQREGTLVALWDHDYESMYVKKQTIVKLQEAHRQTAGGAELGTQLVIIPAEEPNGFAGLLEGKRVVGITTGMIRFVGEDMDQYAALLCHVAAHWLKGHIEWNSMRRGGLSVIELAINQITKAPAGSMAAQAVEGYFNRDDERDADSLSISCMKWNGYDPQGAVRFHEMMLKLSVSTKPAFLMTHPTSEERIENLKRLIRSQSSQP